MLEMKVLWLLWTFTAFFIFKESPAQECGERDESLLEEGRTCRKPCTADDQCKKPKLCLCDDICGMSCYNPNARCRDAGSLQHGVITGEQRFGRTITYTCNRGYLLNGEATRTCRSDKNFTGTAPTCIAGCQNPPRTDVSFPDSVKGEYLIGESVEFICRHGFVQSGDTSVTCVGLNQWSESRYVCVRVQCSDPGEPRNGFKTGEDFGFGSRVSFGCDQGYELSQRQTHISCGIEGEWVGRIPTCIAVECPVPVAPDRGFVDRLGIRTFTYGVEVRYSCQDGYRIEGEANGRCDENGSWDAPTCEVDRDCDFNDRRSDFCTYTLEGEGWTKFLSRDVVNGVRGFIARVSFGRHQANRETKLVSSTFSTDERLCLTFYYNIRTLGSGEDFSVKLARPGERTRLLWSAERRDARDEWLSTDVLLPTNGEDYKIEFTATRGSQANTAIDLDDIVVSTTDPCVDECEQNPCLNGGTCVNRVNSHTCLCRSGYSGSDCSIVAMCDVPRAPRNGQVRPSQGRVVFNTNLVFTCASGYEFASRSRSIEVRCQPDGTLAEIVPTCREIQCKVPDVPSQLRVSTSASRVRIGEAITYTCSHGNVMADQPSGKLTVTCRITGSWSAEQPVCYNSGFVCTDRGNLCNFPFEYKGVSYDKCTTRDNGGVPWCSRDAVYRSLSNRYDTCAICPESWTEWQPWGSCSVTCRSGRRRRRRVCTRGGVGSPYCPGADEESESCNLGSCDRTNAGQYITVPIGSYHYAIFQEAMNRDAAERTCQAYGGDLAKIETSHVNTRLFEAIEDLEHNPASEYPGYHIGANDRTEERRWVWPDGSEVRYTNWKGGEPNNANNEDCGSMRPNGLWNDFPCYRQEYFICQKGALGQWGSWGQCSRTCGTGKRVRERTCGAFFRGTAGHDAYCRERTRESKDCVNAEECTDEEITVGQTIYSFVQSSYDFDTSRAYCQSLGGDLAAIKTLTVQRRLAAKLATLPDDPTSPYYIGFTNRGKSSYTWLDNAPVLLRNSRGYPNWDYNEPEAGVHNRCGVIIGDSGRWRARPCNLQLYFICQREIDPCHERPCQNDGVCQRIGLGRLCACSRYVAGEDCEEIENRCYSFPCMNGGTCSGDRQSYTCDCPRGWGGTNCEEERSGCPFDASLVDDEVVIEGISGSYQASGAVFQLRCRSRDWHLNFALHTLTCMEGGRWMPDYTALTCLRN